MPVEILLSSKETSPLLIGDSPLIRTNTFNNSEYRGTTGLASPGVEVYLPLSPTLALGFMCPSIREVMRDLIRKMGKRANSTAFDYVLALGTC